MKTQLYISTYESTRSVYSLYSKPQRILSDDALGPLALARPKYSVLPGVPVRGAEIVTTQDPYRHLPYGVKLRGR